MSGFQATLLLRSTGIVVHGDGTEMTVEQKAFRITGRDPRIVVLYAVDGGHARPATLPEHQRTVPELVIVAAQTTGTASCTSVVLEILGADRAEVLRGLEECERRNTDDRIVWRACRRWRREFVAGETVLRWTPSKLDRRQRGDEAP